MRDGQRIDMPMVQTIVERGPRLAPIDGVKDPRAVEPLIAALSDESERVRTKAALALGELGDPRAVKPLEELLNDEQEELRRAAKAALEKLRGKREGPP